MRNLLIILIIFDVSFVLRDISALLTYAWPDRWYEECVDENGKIMLCYPYPSAMYDLIS